MTRIVFIASLCVWLGGTLLADDAQTERAKHWPAWRGPNANGVAPHGNPPVEWSETTNVKWKAAVPGLGNATPVIWDDKIFILTAVQAEKREAGNTDAAFRTVSLAEADDKNESPDEPQADEQKDTDEEQPRRRGRGGRRFRGFGRPEPPTAPFRFVVMCLDRESGRVLWEQTADELLPHEGFRVGDNSYASGSPTTDGRYLYVSFGSYGIFCFDLDGNPVWNKDLGDMQTRNAFGEGSSPTLYGDRLIVTWDHEGESKIFCLDAANGEIKWQADRDEPTSWATPVVVEAAGRTQVITNATTRVRSYDLATGELIWECGGQTTNAIPSPVATNGLAICMTGFRGNAAYAIPLDSTGDLTDSDKFAWHYNGSTEYRPGTPYVPSPLLYGDLLYYLKGNTAVLSCVVAKTGEVQFDDKRLKGPSGVYASPVGAADRVYIVGRDGSTAVVKHGKEFEQLATNELDEPIDASPAVVGDEIFLRSHSSLYCIAGD